MRTLRKVVVGLAALYLALLGGLVAVMRHPTLFGQVMRHVPDAAFYVVPFKRLWFVARAGRMNVGDIAPDFSLVSSDRKSRMRLSSFRGQRPVVLIFGSYT